MKKYFPYTLNMLFLLASLYSFSQITVSGRITDSKEKPVSGASMLLKDSYDGTTSDSSGYFSFKTMLTGEQILVISYVGFNTREQRILISQQTVEINVILIESVSELKAVTISAGVFEASDRKRTTILKTIDIVTTAGAQADIFGAINTLPGAQQIGESEGLFVRGGTGAEAKVFIDGMLVNNPFYSSVPDISQRSRFTPLLFKGTVFSSGGYSAQYGQAMSSALVLETTDLPIRSEAQLSFTSIGALATLQQLSKNKTFSAGGSLYYGNMQPYYSIAKQTPDFTKPPENINSEFFTRKKIKSGGILKLYLYSSSNTTAINRPNLDKNIYNDNFKVNNTNFYSNISLQSPLSNNWKINAGVSLSLNRDKIKRYTWNADTSFNEFKFNQQSNLAQARVVFTKSLKKLSKFYVGAEVQHSLEKLNLISSPLFYTNTYAALFTEADVYLSQKIVTRVGLRSEYDDLINSFNLAPRISLAFKLNKNSQFSFAFGRFYQKPESRYLLANRKLNLSVASHFILSFQKILENKTIRIECFQKNYERLVTYDSNNLSSSANGGSGNANGVEIFWRDRKAFKSIDYWISYSFLNTKRKFLNYPFAVQPNFVARHTMNIVMKKFVNAISTNFGLTYTYASGRPYFNPNLSIAQFMSERTIDYHSLGITINYLTQIKKTNSVIFLYVTNVTGNKQVFGYNYGSIKNMQGNYNNAAIMPPAKRFIMLGLFMSIGTDRRQELINNN